MREFALNNKISSLFKIRKKNEHQDETELGNIKSEVPPIFPKPLNTEITVKDFQTQEDAINDLKQQKDGKLCIQFNIKESFKQFDKERFKEITDLLCDHQVITFQNESDGKFSIVWRKSYEKAYAINVFDENLKKDELTDLCSFIFLFLIVCLSENHSGYTNTENSFTDDFNIGLPLLTNPSGHNLLFHAASNGDTEMVKILLNIAFDVNMMHEKCLPIEYAYTNNHFETVLLLLKSNSMFPIDFVIDDCSEDVQKFAEMSQKLHENIKAGNLVDIRKTLSENPDLYYFYDIPNQSAAAASIANKKFDAYELLMQYNCYLSQNEEIDQVMSGLSSDDLKEVREIHFRNKKDIQEQHLNVLLSRTSVGHDVFQVQDKLNHVMRAYKTLNDFPFIKILFKVAAMLTNLHIIFDFNRDSVQYLDPTQDRSTLGLFCSNGRIYIGAKQLLDPLTEHEVFATIAHELCHFVLYFIFRNRAKPYSKNDDKTEAEFVKISRDCQRKKAFDEIINAVYAYYPKDMHHAELIVRIPHFFAHYFKQPSKIEELKKKYKFLFDFYETKIVTGLETALIELKAKGEKKRKAKDRTIIRLIIALVAVFVTLSSLAYWIYEPTYKWSNLDSEQKSKIFDNSVKFEGVDMKFNELFGTDETTNRIFGILSSQQIKLLIKNETLDLNETQNQLLQNKISLVYQNLTEKLKDKVKNATIEFQGENVIVSKLLLSETSSFLTELNSEQTFGLVKNQTLLKIGQKFENETMFFVERRFVDKSKGYYEYSLEEKREILIINEDEHSTLSSDDLIAESLKTKFILLSDDAGIGKTTTFKNLVLKTKQKYPLKWVEFIDLKSKIDVYAKYKENFDFLSILKEIFNLNSLSHEVFEKLYRINQVVLFWDGFDEISPTYTDFMLKLMENIKTNTQNVQFVATRPHYETEICDYLNSVAYKLVSFTKKDNDEFVDKFYNLKNLNANKTRKAKEQVAKLIGKIQEESEDLYPVSVKDYIESPLMLRMIAEISIIDSNSLDVTNLYTIYDSFTNTIFDLTNDKGKLAQIEKNKFLLYGLNLKEIFQYFAVKKYDELSTYDNMNIVQKYKNVNLNTNELSRYGVLIFDSNHEANFVHRTFLEFFAAQYIVDNVYNMRDNPNKNEMRERFDFLVAKLISEPKIKEFLLGYLATDKTHFISSELLSSFRTNLNYLFYEMVNEQKWRKESLLRVNELLSLFPFTKESLEILWGFDKDTTFFCWWAIQKPIEFMDQFDSIKVMISEYFPNDQEKQRKLLFGKNQLGNILYGIRKILRTVVDVDVTPNQLSNKVLVVRLLNLFEISIDFDANELKKFETISEFYNFTKPYLNRDEIRQLFMTNFNEILIEDGTNMWSVIEPMFEQQELQEIIYRGTATGDKLLKNIRNFAIIKSFLKILKGTANLDFFNFILLDNDYFLFEKESIMEDDNFEVIWSEIKDRTTKDEQKKILKANLLNKLHPWNFNLFSTSIEFGSVEKFEKVKSIYAKAFDSNAMREFCIEYFNIYRLSTYIWHPNADTFKAFINYLRTLFNASEIKSQFKESLIRLYSKYNPKEKIILSQSLAVLLKEITTKDEYVRLSFT